MDGYQLAQQHFLRWAELVDRPNLDPTNQDLLKRQELALCLASLLIGEADGSVETTEGLPEPKTLVDCERREVTRVLEQLRERYFPPEHLIREDSTQVYTH